MKGSVAAVVEVVAAGSRELASEARCNSSGGRNHTMWARSLLAGGSGSHSMPVAAPASAWTAGVPAILVTCEVLYAPRHGLACLPDLKQGKTPG